MADPDGFVSNYHDHDSMQSFENMLMSDESFRLDFEDTGEHPFGENRMLNEDVNNNHRWEISNNQFVNDNSQAGPSGFNDQSGGQNAGNFNPGSSGCGNPIQLPEWPVPPMPYTCSCCQVLREIIHTKVRETRKLEIHGRLGMICHGILEICSGDMIAPNKEYQMFDFCKESIYGVKMFLVQYCEERKEAGYTMVKDPLLTFYEALSVGLDWDFNLDFDDIFQGSPIHIGEYTGQQPESTNQPNVCQPQAQSTEVGSTKRHLTEQREITKNLRVKDLVPYFNLPIDDAADKVGVCSTVIKKVCRKESLDRWPYRKIKSIENKIENRIKSLNTTDAIERARAEADIQKLKQDIANFSAPFL